MRKLVFRRSGAFANNIADNLPITVGMSKP